MGWDIILLLLMVQVGQEGVEGLYLVAIVADNMQVGQEGWRACTCFPIIVADSMKQVKTEWRACTCLQLLLKA